MRKVFLSLVAVLLCGVTFAQTEIWTAQGFIDSVEATGSYKLMADIDLGTYSASNNFIKSSFNGTFDGNNHTITYQGSFTANDEGQTVGLFQTNSGTIKNLNLDANITVGGNGEKVKVGLLCGENNGTIEFCDVVGNINSTAKSNSTGNASAGLIIGNNKKTLQYCTGHGNVTGVGYVGGLVGSMGTIMESSNQGYIKGCYFTGNVTANNSNSIKYEGLDLQSFGGGICGFAFSPAKIELCVAEAVIVVGANAGGISTTGYGTVFLACSTVSNNYCTGIVIKNGESSDIDSNDEIVDVAFKISILIPPTIPEYAEDNYCSEDETDVVEALNQAKNDDNFYFAEINGKVVLIVGQPIVAPTYICEAPTGLTVTTGANGTFTASWSVNDQDESVEETTYRCSLTNNGETIESGTTTSTSLSGTLEPSAYPYIFTVQSDCSESQDDLYSDAISYTFYVDANCVSVTGLQVTDITTTAANVSWKGDADTIKLNGSAITLTNVVITEGLTPEYEGTIEGLTPATEYTIEAIVNCTRHEGETEIPYQLYTTVTFVTEATDYVTAQSGNFYTHSTWVGGKVPTGNPGTTITIKEGHKVNLDGTLVLNGTIINRGVLLIPQTRGQLINKTNVNVPGIVEIETDTKKDSTWTFVGAPFTGNTGNTEYKLGAVKPVSGSDVAMVKFNYTSGDWINDWATIDTPIEAGEGIFAWPFYQGVITFSTYDLGRNGTTYPSDAPENCDYALNNGDFEVNKTNVNSSNVNWMSLANPYPAKLSVSKFLADNTGLQGTTIYGWNGSWFDIATQGDIAMTEGFFVNVSGLENKIVRFERDQMTDWNLTTNVNNTQAKSSANELIELTLQNGKDKVRVYFAHNEEAEQGYDIFDANKMFATTGVAEPYFVTEGIALIKEEVAELPYYATMNVRSQEDTVMNFVLTNLPEGYAVSIIDGEEVIDMVEGGVYSTEILTGENADRFKVLVKKNVGIADVEELDVTITNNNRQVNITADKAVRTEVYNILGQKVFETHNTTFVLDNVASGAYVVKVYGASASKTQKIVVE